LKGMQKSKNPLANRCFKSSLLLGLRTSTYARSFCSLLDPRDHRLYSRHHREYTHAYGNAELYFGSIPSHHGRRRLGGSEYGSQQIAQAGLIKDRTEYHSTFQMLRQNNLLTVLEDFGVLEGLCEKPVGLEAEYVDRDWIRLTNLHRCQSHTSIC